MTNFDILIEDFFLPGVSKTSKYPPYNIIKESDHRFRIEFAVAGFTEDELEVTLDNNNLEITGSKEVNNEDLEYIHKGIGSRSFKNTFVLGENTRVEDVILKMGFLTVWLVQEIPEQKKPKVLPISVYN